MYILNDKEVYGKGIADGVEPIAKEQGLEVLGQRGIDTKAANFRAVAQKIKSARRRLHVLRRHHAEQGRAALEGRLRRRSGHQAVRPRRRRRVGLHREDRPRSEAKTYITNPTLDPKLYPPAAQEFFTTFEEKYGKAPEPYAIYGYEAMKVALLAIENAGDKGNDRQAVIDAFFQIKDRESVLGKYSIDENGDTTLSDYGGNNIKDGELVFDKVIKAADVSAIHALSRLGAGPRGPAPAGCPA